MTVTEVKGFGRQHGKKEVYRGAKNSVDFVSKLRIEVIMSEETCAEAVEAIISAARTGKVGDGKIFVTDLSNIIRIRTGEVAQHAI